MGLEYEEGHWTGGMETGVEPPKVVMQSTHGNLVIAFAGILQAM